MLRCELSRLYRLYFFRGVTSDVKTYLKLTIKSVFFFPNVSLMRARERSEAVTQRTVTSATDNNNQRG